MFEGYIILIIICFSAYLANRKHLPSYFIYLGCLVFIVLVIEALKFFLRAGKIEVNPIGHLYQLIELWMVCLTYYHYFSKASVKKTIAVLLIVLTPLYFFISVQYEKIWNESILSFSINSCLYIAFSLIFFYDLYTKGIQSDILTYAFFWINCGNLIYACGTFFQMGLQSYVNKIDPQLNEDLNIINHILNYFLYATYTAGFLCTKKSKS